MFGYNESNNEYYMEYMDYTLFDYINNMLTNRDRRNMVHQIFRGFEYLHSKGYLHRDITPKNVLVKEYDDTLVLKLSDFGLIKIRKVL